MNGRFSRRQFLALAGLLPLALWSEPGSSGGWYLVPGLACARFVVGTGPGVALYRFEYDYQVDEEWLAGFRWSTERFGCHSTFLPGVMDG